MGGKFVRGLATFGQSSAQRNQSDGGAFANDPASSDFEGGARLGKFEADALAAGVAKRRRPVINRRRGRDHVNQFALVRRRHDHKSGQATEIGNVE